MVKWHKRQKDKNVEEVVKECDGKDDRYVEE